MENGTISRISSSTSIQQNSHHYIPLLMSNGNKMSGSLFSYPGSESTTSSTKESGSSGIINDTMTDSSVAATTAIKATSIAAATPATGVAASSLPLTSPHVDQHSRRSKQPESKPEDKSNITAIDNIPADKPSATTSETILPAVKHDTGNSKVPSSSTSKTTSSTSSQSSKSTTAAADLIEGALSDFDGSDLSDLSSASSASGSDGELEKDVNEDSSVDGSADSDESKDDDEDDSSASDDSDSHSRSTSKNSKGFRNKNATRHKNSRRIQSDSSDGEQEPTVLKRKPGRPPKLKPHPARARVIQSPTSPMSPTFSSARITKFGNGVQEDTDLELAGAQTASTESQPRKKTKQPDFTNVSKRDRSGRTQLFKYTALGDLETCQKLIEAGAQVNDRDNADWTPLHEACVTGHEKVAELLIRHHAEVNARGGHLDTPLHDAAQNGHVEVVKLLLAHGANVLAKNAKGVIPIDVTDDKEVTELLQRRQTLINMLTGKNQAGQTLLHRACSSGSYNNVVDLLNQGADMNARDHAQWTPLHEAALEGHTKIVEVLLSRGADPNAQGHGNDTALHDSAQNEHEDVVRLLLEYGADPDFKNAKGERSCDVTDNEDILELLKTGNRGTKKAIPHSTGLMTASSSSLSSLSSQVSKLSASSNNSKAGSKATRRKEGSDDINMSDDGRSASEERPTQMSRDDRKMQQLLSTIRMQEQMEERKKAKKRRPKQVSDDDGDVRHTAKPARSATLWKQPHSKSHHSSSKSASKGSSKVRSKRRSSRSEELDDESDSDSEPSLKPRLGRRSVQRSTGDRFRIDHRFKDPLGRTQLHQWAESGDIEMVGTLLEGGAERDPKDHLGLTPLHLAAKAGNTEVLVLLLAYGCNVNAQDLEKSTALHESVRNHHTEAVRLLLQNNALVCLRDSKQRMCSDLVSPNDVEIRSLLKAAADQVELKAKERSKKRLSQSIESYGSPKSKERKTSRHSDSDEPVRSRKKDSEHRREGGEKHHSRNSSSSGILSKATSMPSIASSQLHLTSSDNLASVGATGVSAGAWKYGNSELNGDNSMTPLKKQRLHSRHLSTSGTATSLLEGDNDIDMKTSGSSKKRRESDRHGDGYGGKVKIKKEREDDSQHLRTSSLSNKAEDLRRVASLPSFLKDSRSSSSGSPVNGASNAASKSSRHGPKTSLSSSRPSSALGMMTESSIASISPPLTETSSSPPPTSAQALAAQEMEVQRSRKRSSQTFASPSGYQKFADDLKLGSVASHQLHSRQRSTTSIPSSRSAAAISSSAQSSAETSVNVTDTDAARKKAKTSSSELISNTTVNGVSRIPGVVSLGSRTEETEKTSGGVDKVIKEESIESQIPSLRSVKDAQRYLPLYTVQLSSESTESVTAAGVTSRTTLTTSSQPQQHFCVVDRQVQLLLGLAPGVLFERYPHLHRRVVTNREKARLWSPLSSMVSDRCAAAVKLNFEVLPAECQFSSLTNATTAMSRLKEHEKQKFLGCELYFIRLEEVVEVIKRDYAQLNESMMTIMLDIGYEEEEETAAMEVEADKQKNDVGSTAPDDASLETKIKKEEREERLKEVKEEDMDSTRHVAGSPSATATPTAATVATSTPFSTAVSGYVHKMRRVPAKMATKAMFKELQQQYRSA